MKDPSVGMAMDGSSCHWSGGNMMASGDSDRSSGHGDVAVMSDDLGGTHPGVLADNG